MRACSGLLLLSLLGCKPEDLDPVAFDVPCPEAPALGEVSSAQFEALASAPGGDIFLLATAPSDPSRLYSASYNNGLHRSDDGGHSWTPVRSQISHISGQVAVHPSDPDRFAYAADALYLSVDGGRSWGDTALGGMEQGSRVRGVAWRGDELWAIDQSGDLWRSQDWGQSFEWVLSVGRRHASPNGWGLSDDWYWLFPDGGLLWVAHQQGALYRIEGWDGEVEQVDFGPLTLLSAALEPDGALRYGVREDLMRVTRDGTPERLAQVPEGEILASTLRADGERLVFTESRAYLVGEGTQLWAEDVPERIVGPEYAVSVGGEVLVAHSEGVARSETGLEAWEDSSEGIADDDLDVLQVHPYCAS